MCCTNTRSGAGEEGRLAQPRPQQSPSATSLSFRVPAHCCCCFPPSSRAPSGRARHNQHCCPRGTESLGHPFRVWATHSTTGCTPGPNFSGTFCTQVRGSDWPSVTHPRLLFAVGFLSAAPYLPVITRKPRKWIRKHLPGRHPALGSVLVLVRKNGYNTLQT